MSSGYGSPEITPNSVLSAGFTSSYASSSLKVPEVVQIHPLFSRLSGNKSSKALHFAVAHSLTEFVSAKVQVLVA